MDAIKFLKEKERMCNHYSDNDMSNLCPCSEQYDNPNYCGADCNNMDYEKLVAIIEDWSEKNPVMTNRDKFKEVFGFHNSIKPSRCSEYTGKTCNCLETYRMPCNHCPWWDEPFSEC